MTKARTKAARRRGRPRKEGPREPNGRPTRIPQERRDDAKAVVIEARARQLGRRKPADRAAQIEWRRSLDAEHLECVAGRAIDGERDRADLWAAIKRISATYRAYWAAIA